MVDKLDSIFMNITFYSVIASLGFQPVQEKEIWMKTENDVIYTAERIIPATEDPFFRLTVQAGSPPDTKKYYSDVDLFVLLQSQFGPEGHFKTLLNALTKAVTAKRIN